ncbi:MAG: response regulator [Deltaproteobacteria bacterium]|nr:response regulator [Deltaproteobacteria bacterium]
MDRIEELEAKTLACIQGILDALPNQYALLVDEDHHIVLANKTTTDSHGVTRDEICGRYCPEAIHGLDDPFPGCPLEEAVEKGRAVERELWDEDSGRWFRSAVYPTRFRTKGGRAVLLHTIFDITEEKAAKDKLLRVSQTQSALDEILVAALDPAPLDRILQIALVKILSIPWIGLEAKGCIFLVDEITNDLVMKAHHNFDAPIRKMCARVPFGHCLCGRAARSGRIEHAGNLDERHENEYEGIRPHGHYCVPIMHDGSVKGVINLYVKAGHTRNETEERFLRAAAGVLAGVVEREQLRASIAQADRMASVGLLAAGVVHEINNPLTYVLYNLESLVEDLEQLVARPNNNSEEKEVAKSLGQELHIGLHDMLDRTRDAVGGARRIREIVKDLKTFSRVEKEAKTRVHLIQVIEAAINMAYNEIKYRARLVKDFRSIPPVVASQGRLAQVFLNLLVNAAQAIEEGDVEHNEIRLRTWADENWVFAEVKDTGKGILPEHMDRLFEPFFTTKDVGFGSGLGLSICHKIITDFGGKIEVRSQVGEGTCFLIRLPIKPLDEVHEEKEAEKKEPESAVVRGRILVIDDEPGICRVIQRTLGRQHEVKVANSGAEGKRILETDTTFDAILCDLLMPNLSGMDLYEWLSSSYPELSEKIVFMTGGAFTPRAREFLARIPNHRFEKPFDPKGLTALIRDLVIAERNR